MEILTLSAFKRRRGGGGERGKDMEGDCRGYGS